MREGAARLMRAPAVLAGTIVLAAVFTVASAPTVREALWLHATNTWSIWRLGFGPLVVDAWDFAAAPWADGTQLLRGLVFWSLASGGVIDRYARDRPTRGRGFFGACGAHAPAMFRVALIALGLNGTLNLWLPRPDGSRGVLMAATVLLFAVSVTLTYAQVRLVVEDRRSALGAILAAARFVRRNPAALVLHALLAVAAGAVKFGLVRVLIRSADEGSMAGVGAAEGLIVVQYLLILLSWAAAAVLFQSRLAHASYTAGPPLEWPENPAAEAIANGGQGPT